MTPKQAALTPIVIPFASAWGQQLYNTLWAIGWLQRQSFGQALLPTFLSILPPRLTQAWTRLLSNPSAASAAQASVHDQHEGEWVRSSVRVEQAFTVLGSELIRGIRANMLVVDEVSAFPADWDDPQRGATRD